MPKLRPFATASLSGASTALAAIVGVLINMGSNLIPKGWAWTQDPYIVFGLMIAAVALSVAVSFWLSSRERAEAQGGADSADSANSGDHRKGAMVANQKRTKFTSPDRRPRPWLRNVLVAAISVALLGVTASYSFSSESEPSQVQCRINTAALPIALVIGMRSNSPQPRISAEVLNVIPRSNVDRDVVVVGVNGARGHPSIQRLVLPSAESKLDWSHARHSLAESVNSLTNSLKSSVPEADLLAAMGYAVDELGSGGGSILVFDSGLQTVQPLDFRVAGMMEADPGDIADLVARRKGDGLPHLAGSPVFFFGIGDTADPQPPLDRWHQGHLKEIWGALIKRVDGCAVFTSRHTTGSAPSDLPSISPVKFTPADAAPIALSCNKSVVLSSASGMSFLPDMAEFSDPHAARAMAINIVKDAKSKGATSIKVTAGSARSGSPESQRALSLIRAEAVRLLLVESGVPVSAIGVGGDRPAGVPAYVPDGTEGGDPNPAAMQSNRFVQIDIYGNC